MHFKWRCESKGDLFAGYLQKCEMRRACQIGHWRQQISIQTSVVRRLGPSDLTTSKRLSASTTFQIWFAWFRWWLVTKILFLESTHVLVNNGKEREFWDVTDLKFESCTRTLIWRSEMIKKHTHQLCLSCYHMYLLTFQLVFFLIGTYLLVIF